VCRGEGKQLSEDRSMGVKGECEDVLQLLLLSQLLQHNAAVH
jgi:hypothetical protein